VSAPTSRLRRARELAGLSLGQAARRLGWAQGPLGAMEIGQGTPPTETDLVALATLYGVSLAWLQGADPVVPDHVDRVLRDADIPHGERDRLLELLGAIMTPGRPAQAGARHASSYGPPDQVVDRALEIASRSPCRSKRGVVLYDPRTGEVRGSGFNSPPASLGCPGRERCSGTCGQRSVHAEVRALREALIARSARAALGGPLDLVHVEIGADGYAVACDGPSCWQCAREVLDVGFVAGVWLYLGLSRCMACRLEDSSEKPEDRQKRCSECGADLTPTGIWTRYLAAEFYHVTLKRCGMVP
jgi:transcriptional regulator with XRE-family HTH domain